MNPKKRKEQFISLLQELLEAECNGIQAELAKKIKIGNSRLSNWLSGKTDPINLDALIFSRIAALKKCSTEELTKTLKFPEPNLTKPNAFRLLLQEMLSNKTQKELGESLGVSQIAISNWLNPEKKIDPANISIKTMLAIARQKGWTIDELLVYLKLQEGKQGKKILGNYQLELSTLSLEDQIKLLIWFLDTVSQKFNNLTNIFEIKENQLKGKTLEKTLNNYQIAIILEVKNLKVVSNYANNLGLHFQIPADNIIISTITQFQEVKKDIDLIIFDIETNSSNIIDRIKKISFYSNIVIFTTLELEEKVREQLEDKVVDIVLKPIDWQVLKDKAYFS